MIELGGYCGYSAVRFGRLLDHNAKYYSFELIPLHAAIATKVMNDYKCMK